MPAQSRYKSGSAAVDDYTIDTDGTIRLTSPSVRDGAIIGLEQRLQLTPIQTANSDLPAASAGAFLFILNQPDTVDFTCIALPFPGTIVAISLVGKPAAGDTVTVTPQLCTSKDGAGAAPVSSLAVQITNAAPSATKTVPGSQADATFAAGTFLGLKYATTTGGVYTPRDLGVILWINAVLP